MNAASFRWRNFFLALALPVVATFTLPSMLASRQARNESKAIGTMEKIRSAEDAFLASSRRLGTIADLVAHGLLPGCVANVSWGYRFDAQIDVSGLKITASPATDISGRWTFHRGPDGVTRYSQQADKAPTGQANEPVR